MFGGALRKYEEDYSYSVGLRRRWPQPVVRDGSSIQASLGIIPYSELRHSQLHNLFADHI